MAGNSRRSRCFALVTVLSFCVGLAHAQEVPVVTPLRIKVVVVTMLHAESGLGALDLVLTRDAEFEDSTKIKTSRARFVGFPNAVKPPCVTTGDDLSASTF
jgi:purine nucleoside permease